MATKPQSIADKKNESTGTRTFFFCCIIIAGIIIDQAVKAVVFSLPQVPKYLSPFNNYYFAFSLPVPLPISYALYAVVLFFAARYCFSKFFFLNKPELLAWALLFAGALSNIGERIMLGYVRDYLPLLDGIFNLADIFIIIAIVMLFINSSGHDF